jgi:hypothetical protein
LKFREEDIVIQVLYLLNTGTNEANQQERPTNWHGLEKYDLAPYHAGHRERQWRCRAADRKEDPARHHGLSRDVPAVYHAGHGEQHQPVHLQSVITNQFFIS